MEQQHQPQPGNKNDELDLGQAFQVIGRGFQYIFNGFLGIFIYIKKNILIIGILLIIGVAVGYFMNKWAPEKLITEIIVKPNLDSKDYLYGVVSEIQANINARNRQFFERLDVEMNQLGSLEVTIEAVEVKKATRDDLKYLEVLQKYENSDFVDDIIQAQMIDQNSFYHRINIIHENPEKADELGVKLMNYINDNTYYQDLLEIGRENANERIKENQKLINQIDDLINLYAKKLAREEKNGGSSQITLQSEEQPYIPDLIVQKNRLIRDLEEKKFELKQLESPVSVVNLGKSQPYQNPLFGSKTVFFPALFLLLFLVFDLLRYLNKRAKQIQH